MRAPHPLPARRTRNRRRDAKRAKTPRKRAVRGLPRRASPDSASTPRRQDGKGAKDEWSAAMRDAGSVGAGIDAKTGAGIDAKTPGWQGRQGRIPGFGPSLLGAPRPPRCGTFSSLARGDGHGGNACLDGSEFAIQDTGFSLLGAGLFSASPRFIWFRRCGGGVVPPGFEVVGVSREPHEPERPELVHARRAAPESSGGCGRTRPKSLCRGACDLRRGRVRRTVPDNAVDGRWSGGRPIVRRG